MSKKYYAYTNKAQKEFIEFNTQTARDNFILANPCSTRAYPDYYQKALKLLGKLIHTKRYTLMQKLAKICKEGQKLGFIAQPEI